MLGGCVTSSSDRLPSSDTGEDAGPAPASSYADPEARGFRRAGAGGASVAPGRLDAGTRVEVASEVSQITEAGTPGSAGYRVGPLDILGVSVFKVPDLTQTVQVSEAGTFGYPLIGEVRAGGHTVREIEQELTSRLGANYVRDPRVTVLVKEYNSHRVTVEGAVKKAGVFPMQGPMSLLQAIAMAGGVDEVSNGTILVFRRVDGQTGVVRYTMNDLRGGGAEDPNLVPGDIVMVPESDLKIGLRYIIQVAPLARTFLLL